MIRDLVTDVSFNYVKADEVPAFTPSAEQPQAPFRMAQVDVERSQEFRKCIECFLCQNTCHVIRDHDDNKPAFSGPRFFIRYAELDMHPNDAVDRRRLVQDAQGPRVVQHHQVLHRGVPGEHQDHRQRHHPHEGAGGGRQVRPLQRLLAEAGAESQPDSPGPDGSEPGALACTRCVTRTCGAVWSARRPVKPEDAGSNPVRSAVG